MVFYLVSLAFSLLVTPVFFGVLQSTLLENEGQKWPF